MRALLPALALLLASCTTVSKPPPGPPPSGTAYAWARFDARGVVASGAEGFADRTSGRQLTIDDPFRIASISKLVVALGVMRLVEQGRLDLDRDVSAWLGWQLRNPGYKDSPITLRLLLSHRSSLTDAADYAIPLGDDVRTRVARAGAFDTAHAPGTYFRYSNLNFPVIASVLEAATGERFDRLMHRLVMEPLDLDACFNWTTCSDSALGRAVILYQPDGTVLRDDLKGRQPECPVVAAADGSCDLAGYRLGTNGALFSPQGGLRASVRDLATLGRLLLGRGRLDGKRFLSEQSIDEMLRPHWRYEGANGETEEGFYCSYGLAVQSLPVAGCRDDLFGDGRSASGHAGDAYGVRSGLWIEMGKGRGIAYFSAGNGEDPIRGRTAYRAVEEWLASR